MISNQPFPLTASYSSNNTNILNNIYQMNIKLELKPPENEIQKLLLESISYLDKEIDTKTFDELIYLIFTFMSHVSDQPEDFYNSIFNESQKNSYRLIFFAKIFSQKRNISSSQDVTIFIQDIMTQILNQIQDPKDVFLVQNLEIKPKYLKDFIIDIISMSDLNEKSVSILYPYIFSQKNLKKSQVNMLSKKVMKKELINSIPEIAISNKIFFSGISVEFLDMIIPNLTRETFFKILPSLCDILKFVYYGKDIANTILHKCDEIEYNINDNEKLLLFIKKELNDRMMNPFVWNYLTKFDIKIPIKAKIKMQEYFSPFDEKNLQIFEFASNLGIIEEENNKEIFSQKRFWINLFSVISSSDKKYSRTLLTQFTKAFNEFVAKENIYDIFETMIFNDFPPTNNGNDFLFDLLNGLANKDHFYKNEEILLKKIIEKKVLPLPSFWRLFNYSFIEKYYKEDGNEKAILCAICFSRKTFFQKFSIEKITIQPVANEISQKFIINFIQNNDLDYVVKMDYESLSFVASVLLCIDEQNNFKIKGLKNRTILPFLAILLNILSQRNCKTALLKEETFEKKMLGACDSLPRIQSPLLIESINSILSSGSLNNFDLFTKMFSFKIFNIFMNQLFLNTYKADKLILLREIFKLIKSKFDKNLDNLFKYIIHNRQNITDFDSLASVGLCPSIFKLKSSSSFLKDIIENSTVYDEVVNTIWFVNNFYPNCPLRNINLNNLLKIINEKNKIKSFDDFILLCKFIENHKIKGQQKNLYGRNCLFNNIEKFVTKICSNHQFEKAKIPLKYIYQAFMSDYSIVNDYIIVLFEKISYKQTVSPRLFLEHFKSQFENFKGALLIILIKFSYIILVFLFEFPI